MPHRRAFFGTIIKAAASASLLTCPVVAAAMQRPDKYRRTLALADALISARRPQFTTEQDEGFERVLGYMLEHFDATSVTNAEVAVVFETGPRDGLDLARLRGLTEGVVPVAVAKELLFTHRIEFRRKNVASFATFAERYGSML